MHTSERSAVPHRAWIASVLLIIVVSILAGTMVWTRAGELLAPRIEPRGLGLSLRHPRHFQARCGLTDLGWSCRFFGIQSGNAVATMDVYRTRGTTTGDAVSLCKQLLQIHTGLPAPFSGMSRLTRFDRQLGPLDASEIWDPQLGVVVRAAQIGDGDACAVVLGVSGAGIAPDTYRLFDLMCGSIEFVAD